MLLQRYMLEQRAGWVEEFLAGFCGFCCTRHRWGHLRCPSGWEHLNLTSVFTAEQLPLKSYLKLRFSLKNDLGMGGGHHLTTTLARILSPNIMPFSKTLLHLTAWSGPNTVLHFFAFRWVSSVHPSSPINFFFFFSEQMSSTKCRLLQSITLPSARNNYWV